MTNSRQNQTALDCPDDSQRKPHEQIQNSAASTAASRWTLKQQICVCLCGFALLAISTFWAVCERMIAPVPMAISEINVSIPVSPISLETESGATVKGWAVRSDQNFATIVLLHPLRGSRLTMLSRASLLHRHGYSVVMIDLQGHGESPGDAITMGHEERHSASAAVQYAKESANGRPVIVVGMSLGGASFLLSQQTEVDGVILESVYPTITEAIHDRITSKMGSQLASVLGPILLWQMELRLQLSRDDLEPIDQLSKLTCPVLMMSGSNDLHTTQPETQRMFDALKPRAIEEQQHELWFVNQAAHVDLYDFAAQEYEARVLSFLERIMAHTKQ